MGTWRRVTRDTEAIDSAAVATRRVSASHEVAHAVAERVEAAAVRGPTCEKIAQATAERAEVVVEREAACEEGACAVADRAAASAERARASIDALMATVVVVRTATTP